MTGPNYVTPGVDVRRKGIPVSLKLLAVTMDEAVARAAGEHTRRGRVSASLRAYASINDGYGK